MRDNNISNDIKILGGRIKALRIKKDLTQYQLAIKAKISMNTLSHLEQGEGNPLIGTLYKISKALNIRLHILCSKLSDKHC
ncbi:MAG: helix-turn-helix transcriptional regulator [Patescibacteria group bacterium]